MNETKKNLGEISSNAILFFYLSITTFSSFDNNTHVIHITHTAHVTHIPHILHPIHIRHPIHSCP